MKTTLKVIIFLLLLGPGWASVSQAGPGGGDGPFPWNLSNPCWESQDQAFRMCFALDQDIPEIRLLMPNKLASPAVGNIQKEFENGTFIARLRDAHGTNWTLWIAPGADRDLIVHMGNNQEQIDLVMKLIK